MSMNNRKGSEKVMSKQNYFFCYNSRLSKFLELKDIHYITKALHPSSNKMFTLYENNEELTKAINDYKTVFNNN